MPVPVVTIVTVGGSGFPLPSTATLFAFVNCGSVMYGVTVSPVMLTAPCEIRPWANSNGSSSESNGAASENFDQSGAAITRRTVWDGSVLLIVNDPVGVTTTLHSHLRMDGSWRTYRPGEHWRGGPAHTIRVVLETDTVIAVGYHLHDIALVPTPDEHTLVDHLGPDLLGPDWDAALAIANLSATR